MTRPTYGCRCRHAPLTAASRVPGKSSERQFCREAYPPACVRAGGVPRLTRQVLGGTVHGSRELVRALGAFRSPASRHERLPLEGRRSARAGGGRWRAECWRPGTRLNNLPVPGLTWRDAALRSASRQVAGPPSCRMKLQHPCTLRQTGMVSRSPATRWSLAGRARPVPS